MTYVALPAFRVLTAARKSYDTFDPNKHGLEGEYADRRRSFFRQLDRLCQAAMAYPVIEQQVVNVSLADFSWIEDEYVPGGF